MGGALLLGGCAQVGTTPQPALVPAPAPAPAQAQAPKPVAVETPKVASEPIAQFLDDRMTLALGLTPQERAKVHAINLKYAQTPEAPGRESELKATLTAAQYDRYQSIRADLNLRLDAWESSQ